MKARILVVDDSEIERKLISKALADEYSIIQCSNGFEALNTLLYSMETFDLIILDVMMPIIDGFEVVRQMRERVKHRDLPVILVTSEGTATNVMKSLELGIHDFIVKPYNVDEVRNRIERILAQVGRLREGIDLSQLMSNPAVQGTDISALSVNNSAGSYKKYHSIMDTILKSMSVNRFPDFYAASERMVHYMELLMTKIVELHPDLITKKDLEMAINASKFYDIGMLTCPDALIKETENGEELRKHVEAGRELTEVILSSCNKKYTGYALDIIGKHHEHADGSGYPAGLIGNAVPVWANAVGFIVEYDKYIQNLPIDEQPDFIHHLGAKTSWYLSVVLRAYDEVIKDMLWVGRN